MDMKLFEYIDRLSLMHKLIEEKCTSTLDYFAERLSISKRKLFNIIDELKIMGAPIYYDNQIKSYRYEKEYYLNVEINMKLLNKEELSDLNEGGFLTKCNFISLDPHIFVK